MSAKDIFHVGMRVKLTQDGISHLGYLGNHARVPYNDKLRGTVVGFGRDDWVVRVHRDGIKKDCAYSIDFWEPAGGDDIHSPEGK